MKDRTYWHGGPRVEGNYLLPPALTGTIRVGTPDDNEGRWVYVTPTQGLALTYASTIDDPWLYEVQALGKLEQDPTSKLPPGESLRCEAARIVRRFKPSRREVERRRQVVRAALLLPDSQLAAMLDHEAGR